MAALHQKVVSVNVIKAVLHLRQFSCLAFNLKQFIEFVQTFFAEFCLFVDTK